MEETTDDEGLFCQLRVKHIVQFHSDETEPNNRNYPIPQCFSWVVGVLLCQDMDQDAQKIWSPQTAFHQAGKHRYSDMRGCLLRHRLQRYVSLFSFSWICIKKITVKQSELSQLPYQITEYSNPI